MLNYWVEFQKGMLINMGGGAKRRFGNGRHLLSRLLGPKFNPRTQPVEEENQTLQVVL